MPGFDKYIGIDWSGAKGKNQPGLQIAIAHNGNAAPKLISPPVGKWWSRVQVLAWVAELIKDERSLIGFDFAFAYAHADMGCYFPSTEIDLKSVLDLWSVVEDTCQGVEGLYGAPFYKRKDMPFHRHFLSPYGKGDLYQPRKRLTEINCQHITAPHPVTKCIGAANVGTGSLAGMRVLHRFQNDMNEDIAIWPFEKSLKKSVAVEIFPRLYFKQAGVNPQNWRDKKTLNHVLKYFESQPLEVGWMPEREDEPDALISAAALRSLSLQPANWLAPEPYLQATDFEGWIFGVK